MEIGSDSPLFEYEPLESKNHIRLIVLECRQQGSNAGSPNSSGRGRRVPKEVIDTSPIHCRIVHVKLGEVAYEALSYEWGSLGKYDDEIFVAGRRVRVRRNLWEALLNIRNPRNRLVSHGNRVMWIDALCINQNDSQERNHQVQLMGQIFSQAEQVVVWLGRGSHSSQSAMFRISSLYAEITTPEDALKYYRREGFSHPEIGAMISLCSRSYWRRIWVVQEIHLSKRLEICCGNRSVSGAAFEYLYNICKALDRIDFMSTLSHTPALDYHIAKTQESQTLDFYHWIYEAIEKDFNCSEPRDITYALLGASRDIREGAVLPDYDKPIEEVFMDTWALLVAEKGLVVRAELSRKINTDFVKALAKRSHMLREEIEAKELSFAHGLAMRLGLDWENKQLIEEMCKKVQERFQPLEILTAQRAEGM
jgi:hypothetical protein